jgi:hypothetical protein
MAEATIDDAVAANQTLMLVGTARVHNSSMLLQSHANTSQNNKQRSHTHAHTRGGECTRIHTRTRRHIRAHAHSHTHTRTQQQPQPRSLSGKAFARLHTTHIAGAREKDCIGTHTAHTHHKDHSYHTSFVLQCVAHRSNAGRTSTDRPSVCPRQLSAPLNIAR